jgi:hypothetical protein
LRRESLLFLPCFVASLFPRRSVTVVKVAGGITADGLFVKSIEFQAIAVLRVSLKGAIKWLRSLLNIELLEKDSHASGPFVTIS